eukprot:PhM_4_TR18627/c1_g1_i1/m.27365
MSPKSHTTDLNVGDFSKSVQFFISEAFNTNVPTMSSVRRDARETERGTVFLTWYRIISIPPKLIGFVTTVTSSRGFLVVRNIEALLFVSTSSVEVVDEVTLTTT